MEPQLEGCGKPLADYELPDELSLQWSRNLRVAESTPPRQEHRQPPAASMEPQLEGCGKITPTRMYEVHYTPLQWSRNLRVAERPLLVYSLLAPPLASMEPQLEGCGKIPLRGGPRGRVRASMEPQLEGCGKHVKEAIARGFESASMEPQLEGCGKRSWIMGAVAANTLQWSRNLRVAESAAQWPPPPRRVSFNGAAT